MGQHGRAGSWVSRQAHWAATGLCVLRFCSAARLCNARGFWGGKFFLDAQPAPLSREESDTEGTAWWVAQWNVVASDWRQSKSGGLFNKLKNYQHLWNWKINWVSTMMHDLQDSFVVWSPSTICIYFLANIIHCYGQFFHLSVSDVSAILICTMKSLFKNENHKKYPVGGGLESDLQIGLCMSTCLPEVPQYRSSAATYVKVHTMYD